jgi:hypothetical protein
LTSLTLRRAIDFLLLTEVVWVALAILLVYVSIIWDLKVYSWIGLAVAFMPFPLRLIRQGRPSRGTPFDIPILIFLAGALMGMLVSADVHLSLGAFQSCLAVTLLYYSLVNHPKPGTVLKWGFILLILLTLLSFLLGLSGALPPTSDSPDIAHCHGMTLTLAIIVVVLAGIALFGKRKRLRIGAGLFFLLFIGIVFSLKYPSLERLFSGVSLSIRADTWQHTIHMLQGHYFTGIGLGCWAMTPPPLRPWITHPHNAYLELYCDTGILGVIAAFLALVIAGRLAFDILRSSRAHPWYGFGIGLIIAILVTLLAGVIETAPFGTPIMLNATYRFLILPMPWLLGAGLVLVHRVLKEQPSIPERQEGCFPSEQDIQSTKHG